MGGRRRSSSELPHAPLELTHPLSICAADIPGTELLRELPPEVAPAALRLLRVVLAWSRDPAGTARALDTSALARPERDGCPLPEPLADLAAVLSRLSEALPNAVALAALGVCDWALDEGAECTALAFAEAAALAWPRNARLAWVVGRLHRGRGRMRDAERWLKRSHRVAVWTDDWESQARTLNSLGNLNYVLGNYAKADARLARALTVARRHASGNLVGEVLHDLLVVASFRRDFDQAEQYGREAFDAYSPDHPRLAHLAFDLSYLWLRRGYCERAFAAFSAIVGHFNDPDDRLQVLAAMIRAAGSSGDKDNVHRLWGEAWSLVHGLRHRRKLATCLLDLGVGAAAVGDLERATEILNRALAEAQERGEGDTIIEADAVLQEIQRCKGAAPLAILLHRASESGTDPFAQRVIKTFDGARPLREEHQFAECG